MTVNATLVNLYHVCKREMWLHANGIRMEHTSETVADGKLLHETSYPQRADRYSEIALSAMLPGSTINLTGKIDFYDNKDNVVHEIKRSGKAEDAHTWQAKYYIWLLELNGITGATATLEYPKLRQTKEVLMSLPDRAYLQETIPQIAALTEQEQCPPRINSTICKSCSYYEFCYVDE